MENQIETPKVKLSWSDFRSQAMCQIANFIENSNCSKFKIMGFKHLDIRLILYFDDCNQVFDFDKGEFEVEVKSFYTKDISHEEMMVSLRQWKEESERDLPETK